MPKQVKTAALKPGQIRKQQALANRRRMLKAAYELFCESGYAPTTMDAIAERAGVAVQTLYFTFHTKANILNETIGACVMGFDAWTPNAAPTMTSDPRKAFEEFHPWFLPFEREKDPRRALAIFIESSLPVFARVAPLMLAVLAWQNDPELRPHAQLGDQRRVE